MENTEHTHTESSKTETRKRMENTELVSRMHDQKEPKRNRLDDDSIIYSTMNTGNRLFKFSESLMLRILFFLPARDAARISLLSKTWRRLWSSLPTHSFKFYYDTFQNNYLPEEGENLGFDEILDKFIKFVDDSLFMIRGEKIKIESFVLHLPSYESKLQIHTNQWIELVTKNPIKELKIWSDYQDENTERYVLPRAISIVKSLSTLNLKGLELNETIPVDDSKFPCLRSLSLSMVNLSRETAENLLSSCPLLEEFAMRSCLGLTHLCIPNLPMLKKVYVYGLDGIDVEASNLENLDCTILSSEWELGALACNNLKQLTVRSNPTVLNQMVEEIFSKFLLLEKLHLSYHFLSLEPYSIRIIIASHELKSLSLSVSRNPVEIEIDTPNLKTYQYSSTTIPSIFPDASSLESAIFDLHLQDNLEINTVWFIKLQTYLMMFKNHEFLSLTISSNSRISFNPMEWTATYGSELPRLENLIIYMTSSKRNYEALIEGLLWVCHPKSLSVPLEDEEDGDLVKFLYQVLTKRKDGLQLSSRPNSSFWLHGLKEVKISGLEIDDENDLDLELWLNFEANKLVKFEFTW